MTNPASILIVDDSSTTSGVLRGILSSAGYKVLGELANGRNLQATIADKQPNVIYLDYHLPDSNGLDLLKAIKSTHPSIAVVMITGNTDPDIERIAAELGGAGFIHKPFTEIKIVKQLEQIAQAQRFLADANKTHAAEPQRRATAIVADDSSTMRAMLTVILSGNGVQVLGEASNGKEAVDLATEHQPDILCLDIEMPSMNGLEALQLIRNNSPATKIVMITSTSSKEVVMQASRHGAAGYIVKPFDPDKVGATKLGRHWKNF